MQKTQAIGGNWTLKLECLLKLSEHPPLQRKERASVVQAEEVNDRNPWDSQDVLVPPFAVKSPPQILYSKENGSVWKLKGGAKTAE